jgi:large subunit ribosomal protein L24e
MAKCFFCGGKTPEARGKMFVRNDGKIFYFCNSKCEGNWKLGREGKSVKWTQAFQKSASSKAEKKD